MDLKRVSSAQVESLAGHHRDISCTALCRQSSKSRKTPLQPGTAHVKDGERDQLISNSYVNIVDNDV